jgi:probable phosphoglycerate mutase
MLPPNAVRLILVRHGEVPANREMRYLGSRDDALTDTGHMQALRIAETLATLPIVAVYSSPRRRTLETARPIARIHNLDVIPSIALRETDYGAWEGRSRAEILAAGGNMAAHLRAWEHDPALAPPGGESMLATDARVLAEVEAIRERHTLGIVVIVSHVGPIKSIIRHALGMPSGQIRMFLDPGTISVVDWEPSTAMLRLFNSHGHLGWDQARWIRG